VPSFTPRPAGRCRDCEFLSDLQRCRDRSRLCRIRPSPHQASVLSRWLNHAFDAVDRILRVLAPLDCEPKDRTDDPKDPVNRSVCVFPVAKLVAKLSTVVTVIRPSFSTTPLPMRCGLGHTRGNRKGFRVLPDVSLSRCGMISCRSVG
jgi:hypothetical protein